MNIALIGYGKMGHAVEAEAAGRGHRVVCTVDNDSEWDSKAEALRTADVAIEFSTPATAVANIRRCFDHGLPVVSGTTGWNDRLEEVRSECLQRGQTLFTASNFSIGMNIMFALNERLAELMASYPQYRIGITETHHIHKLDAPSGTAITLREQIVDHLGRNEEIPIESIGEGEVAGIHTVVYDSEIDTLTLTHEAHSRKGLAVGALIAAEFVVGKKGCFTMKDLLNV
jgi:4-hydroxy-tetrahydrodipicolinate reductase